MTWPAIGPSIYLYYGDNYRMLGLAGELGVPYTCKRHSRGDSGGRQS